jgi:hypothetical protein
MDGMGEGSASVVQRKFPRPVVIFAPQKEELQD